MRTVIYVHQPTTLTIETTDPRDAVILLARYNQRTERVASGARRFDAGIYLLLSNGAVEVTGDHTTIESLREDKDPPSTPRAQLIALEPGASAESILQFVEIAMGISVGPAAAPSPTSKITNDPDGI